MRLILIYCSVLQLLIYYARRERVDALPRHDFGNQREGAVSCRILAGLDGKAKGLGVTHGVTEHFSVRHGPLLHRDALT